MGASLMATETIKIQKDLDWIDNKRRLKLGPVKAGLLMNQLKSDCCFLAKQHIMDYSLLVGTHFLLKGNAEHLFDRSMTVIEQNPENQHQFIKKSVIESQSTSPRMSPDPGPLKMCVFYNEMNGFRATHQDDSPADEIYYLGIIDILTPYGHRKKLEHIIKAIRYDRDSISTINPSDYAKRFIRFIAEYILKNPPSKEHISKPLPITPD
jgi:1-phosphatidylinositol-4-phosphate 5-kinase